MKEFFLLLCSLIIFHFCNSPQSISQENPQVKENKKKPTKVFYPAGEKEKILNEKGEEVQITDLDPEPFQLPSNDPLEYFRVVITGESYQLRQIRGTDLIRRKPDLGGDQFIVEEVAKYDLIDKVDDGLILTKLNPKTGKLENVNFYKRMPRIHNLAKIMQNDSTRWVLEHKPDQEPIVTKYYVTYYIILKNKKSREEIKEILQKEVKR